MQLSKIGNLTEKERFFKRKIKNAIMEYSNTTFLFIDKSYNQYQGKHNLFWQYLLRNLHQWCLL